MKKLALLIDWMLIRFSKLEGQIAEQQLPLLEFGCTKKDIKKAERNLKILNVLFFVDSALFDFQSFCIDRM